MMGVSVFWSKRLQTEMNNEVKRAAIRQKTESMEGGVQMISGIISRCRETLQAHLYMKLAEKTPVTTSKL